MLGFFPIAGLPIAGNPTTGGGGSPVFGDFSQSIGDFTLSADADLLIQATLTQSFGDFTFSSDAVVLIEADSGVGSIGDFTLSATGALLLQASLTQAIGDFTLSSDTDLLIQATLTGSIGAFALSAEADVLIEGDDGVGSIGDFTIDFTVVHAQEPAPRPGGWLPVKLVGGSSKPEHGEQEEPQFVVSDDELSAFIARLQEPAIRNAQITAAIEALKADVMDSIRAAELEALIPVALEAMVRDDAETDLLLLTS